MSDPVFYEAQGKIALWMFLSVAAVEASSALFRAGYELGSLVLLVGFTLYLTDRGRRAVRR